MVGARAKQGLGREWGDLGSWIKGGKVGGVEFDRGNKAEEVVGMGRGRKSELPPSSQIPPGAQTSGITPVSAEMPSLSTPDLEATREQPTLHPTSNNPASADLPIESTSIFTGITVLINGSTYPLVSDHKLKYLLIQHGARVAISLGRKKVTHVILGRENGSVSGKGVGGGLAGGKIEKEIRRVGGKGVKFVGVEW